MESYVFYRSFHEAFAFLSVEDYGRMMWFINEYALDGIEPTIDEPILNMAFRLIRPQIDANARRREHGRLGGRPKKEEKLADSKKPDELDFKPKKTSRFQKPTIEEVEAYIKEKKFSFSAEKFIDYYESKGWVVGKSPMKNWKSACNIWERNNQEFKPANSISMDSETIEDLENFFKKEET